MTNTSGAEPADGVDEQNVESQGEEQRLIVEFAVPTDDFLLATTLEVIPETIVEFEQFVPTNADSIPYLWTTGDNRETFEHTAATDPTVDQIDRIAAFDQGTLYRLDWGGLDDDEDLFGWLRSNQATVLQSESLDGEWLLKLRLPSRDELGDLQRYRQNNEIHFRLVRSFSMTEPKMGQFNISEKQREVLLTALETGYYEIPRDATLTEIAENIDISPNSASERLRRAQTNLLNNTVTIGQPTGIGIDTE